MKAIPNARCGKCGTAAEFVRLGNGKAEIWVGHDDSGRYRYGWVVEGTEEEFSWAAAMMKAINDPSIPMPPSTMGEAMAAAAKRTVRGRQEEQRGKVPNLFAPETPT